MKLTTRRDVEAPLDAVFRELTDFVQIERMAMRRGVEIERTADAVEPGPGMAWRLQFAFRGKPRDIAVRLEGFDPGNALDYGLEGAAFQGVMRIEVMALSPGRTRMLLAGEVRPRTLAARLVIRSARLVKGRVQSRLDAAAGRLAGMIEERCRAAR